MKQISVSDHVHRELEGIKETEGYTSSDSVFHTLLPDVATGVLNAHGRLGVVHK